MQQPLCNVLEVRYHATTWLAVDRKTTIKESGKKITVPNLFRWSGLAAMGAGIIFVTIQPIHPADVLSSVTTTSWAAIMFFKTVMSILFVYGITGLYARQVEESGWLGLAGFLMVYHGSPGPLSAAHAQVIKGTFIKSCKQCHADQGLTQGCLSCHHEIAGQIHQNRGYHAYLVEQTSRTCQQCHPEHHGAAFPLVSDLAWQGQDPNAFGHPHVDFPIFEKP